MGELFKIIFSDTTHFIEFLGEMLVKLLSLIIHPMRMRWRDFPFHFTNSGVNALPIVILIVFLIGVITGYQGAIQLQAFGADIYIANLIGISITRELAPLMTAILVAGRSGSAFAAEIGTMKVSEEIDALKSMGFDVVEFLVLPRVLSVMIAMPLLTLLADVAGIGGGLLMAVTTLNLTMVSYLNQLQAALSFGDIFSGIGKSIVFGFLIATVGCFRGFQVRGGAESVGRYTTASVVSGVLLIILADAVFSFIFQAVGI
jgi:phospholipid/cholesterol/gamma-HCH transport system permease protein